MNPAFKFLHGDVPQSIAVIMGASDPVDDVNAEDFLTSEDRAQLLSKNTLVFLETD